MASKHIRTTCTHVLARIVLLSRVTGGDNGRGEQNKSLTKEEQYTPIAITVRRLPRYIIKCVSRNTDYGYTPSTKLLIAKEVVRWERCHEESVCSEG
jgi:hypothetical protein